jgi:hypothetical protein
LGYLGSSEDLLFVAADAASNEVLQLVRAQEPGVLHRIGGDRAYTGSIYFSVDEAATAIGFSVAENSGTGAYRFFLSDMKVPAVSVPVELPASDPGNVYVWGVFESPRPP